MGAAIGFEAMPVGTLAALYLAILLWQSCA
jgi:hypothetical protein